MIPLGAFHAALYGPADTVQGYPSVYSEVETMYLVAHHGKSIARFGDGELRLAAGGQSISQQASPAIRKELRSILTHASHDCLVGIPRLVGPKMGKTWYKYQDHKFISLYNRTRIYGSAFITRPDSAPWIDHPTYWDLVRETWTDKDVILVAGSDHSLIPAHIELSCNSFQFVEAPYRDAYERIDALESRIGDATDKVVILCVGAAATCLAVRLHRKFKCQAIDFGHIGRMLKQAGRWATAADPLSVVY